MTPPREQSTSPGSCSGGLPYGIQTDNARIEEPVFHQLLAELEPSFTRYASDPPPAGKAIFSLAARTDDLHVIRSTAAEWAARFNTMIVVGSGGSGLSAKALCMLACGIHMACLPRTVHVLDNLDPVAMKTLLQHTDLSCTCFLVISKSGRTLETFALTSVILDRLRQIGITDFSEHMTCITMPGGNPLRALAEEHRLPVLDHDPDLGGRFSIFSAVGMIPAAFTGFDVNRMREGMTAALTHNLTHTSLETSPAAQGAALHVAWLHSHRTIQVLMPYSEQFYGLGLWWRQSWAESLGKNNVASTPVLFLGPADQHSQLQLCLGGTADKCFTFLLPPEADGDIKLPPVKGEFSYLSGHTLGEVVLAQAQATLETLIRHNRPIRIIRAHETDEYTLGALLMHMTLEIIFVAALLKINPFDQPAVEESKRLAHLYLSGESS